MRFTFLWCWAGSFIMLEYGRGDSRPCHQACSELSPWGHKWAHKCPSSSLLPAGFVHPKWHPIPYIVCNFWPEPQGPWAKLVHRIGNRVSLGRQPSCARRLAGSDGQPLHLRVDTHTHTVSQKEQRRWGHLANLIPWYWGRVWIWLDVLLTVSPNPCYQLRTRPSTCWQSFVSFSHTCSTRHVSRNWEYATLHYQNKLPGFHTENELKTDKKGRTNCCLACLLLWKFTVDPSCLNHFPVEKQVRYNHSSKHTLWFCEATPSFHTPSQIHTSLTRVSGVVGQCP